MHRRPRDYVALILAVSAGLSVLALTVAAIWDERTDTAHAGLSSAYTSLLISTLGVMVGALAGYIGGRHEHNEQDDDTTTTTTKRDNDD